MTTGALWEPAEPSADYVAVTPSGGISATTLQAALVELDTEKVPYTDSHYVAAKYLEAINFGALI